MHLNIINRTTGKIEQEQVWGGAILQLLYGDSFWSKTVGRLLLPILTAPILTRIWGAYHDTHLSARATHSFCKRFRLNQQEFLHPISHHKTFNEFFIRSLKSTARPISQEAAMAVMPADARYSIYQNIGSAPFQVKGAPFNLEQFLGDATLSQRFRGGTLLLARLCPLDCHRFYFPFAGIASPSKRIAGSYLSVNPLATNKHPSIFWSNVREYTLLETVYGTIGIVEIGATNCASIVQTYKPGYVEKGAEKGYFKLGGSAVALLFQEGALELADDLVELSTGGVEILALIGQQLGTLKQNN